jgi:ssRNA-specific RNase YbeY (16S rRNA maturation enzyme)
VEDEEMQEYVTNARGINAPTDILSFALAALQEQVL